MKKKTEGEIEIQIADLRLRLSEAIETLAAIRRGEVDGLVVSTPKGEQLVTLGGMEQSYQGMFETLKGHVPEDVQGLIHQLKAHHEELETQNEELRRMQMEIEKSRRMYADLYDFAPVGYFLFDRMGVIHSANLTGAKMVGWNQHDMLGLPFTLFILKEDIGFFLDHVRNVFNNHSKQIELRILGDKRKSVVQVQLQSVIAKEIQGEPTFCRTTLIDITERKQAEEVLRQQKLELEGRTAELQDANKLLKTSGNRLQDLSARLLQAHEEERRRIAGEIHDCFGSSLSSIKYKIESMQEDHPSGYGDLESLKNQVQGLIEESRRIQMALRPSILDDLGIVAALKWFTREFRKTYSHMEAASEIDVEEHQIPELLKTPIFRICQESFNNAAKHSKATTIKLSIIKRASSLELRIQDNGIGFERKALQVGEGSRRGLGLSSMEERASLSDGVFGIHSELGKGTLITVSWPIWEDSIAHGA